MTTLTDYQSARSTASRTAAPADFTIVGLWSLLGLGLSAMFVMAGFATDLGAIVW